MMRGLLRFGCLVLLLSATARPAAAQGIVNWNAILRALGSAMESWRLSPAVQPTATALAAVRTPTASKTLPPTRTETATRVPSITRTSTRPTITRTPTSTRRPATATRTRTGTRTRTVSPLPSSTRTAPPTRTPSRTRTITATRTQTRTRTITPTRTPTPTFGSGDGQIAFQQAEGLAPVQRLASALIIFPYIRSDSTFDTRIELINMSDQDIDLQCFYVRKDPTDCFEIGFFVSLTPQQPLGWLARDGTNNVLTFTAVPPFDGIGELKCAVMPETPNLEAHNALQGRALVYEDDGVADGESETVGYGAIGFQRLVPGGFSGTVELDGFTYEACPDRLHFQVLTRNVGSTSDLILVPCTQDLFSQTFSNTTVQLQIINEFEQVFSSSFTANCHTKKSFSQIGTLSGSSLGTDTAHLVVRGVHEPVLGLVIDRFQAFGRQQTTANDPFVEGSRAATIILP